MITIYKYQLSDLVTQQMVSMPVDAKILSVGLQAGIITLWAEVSLDAPMTDVTFQIFVTGYAAVHLYPHRKFLATLQRPDGIVLHIYQIFP